MSSWNGNRFSVYTSEEKSVLGLIKEMGDQTNYNSDEIVRLTESDNKKVSHQEMQEVYKIDKQANFTGSWFGIKKPTQSSEGLAATVDQLIDETIPSINSQLEQNKNLGITSSLKGNEGIDISSQVQALVDYANINGINRIVFKKGEYNFANIINMKSNIELDFQGSKVNWIGNIDFGIEQESLRNYGLFRTMGVIDYNVVKTISSIRKSDKKHGRSFVIIPNNIIGLNKGDFIRIDINCGHQANDTTALYPELHQLCRIVTINTNTGEVGIDVYNEYDYSVRKYSNSWYNTGDLTDKCFHYPIDSNLDICQNAKLWKVNVIENVTIKNLVFEDKQAYSESENRRKYIGCIANMFAHNINFENIIGYNMKQPLILNRLCQKIEIKNIEGYFADAVNAGLGYVTQTIWSNNVICDNVRGAGIRHVCDFSGVIDGTMKNCQDRFNNASSSLGLHGMCEYNIVIENCSGGYISLGHDITYFPSIIDRLYLKNVEVKIEGNVNYFTNNIIIDNCIISSKDGKFPFGSTHILNSKIYFEKNFSGTSIFFEMNQRGYNKKFNIDIEKCELPLSEGEIMSVNNYGYFKLLNSNIDIPTNLIVNNTQDIIFDKNIIGIGENKSSIYIEGTSNKNIDLTVTNNRFSVSSLAFAPSRFGFGRIANCIVNANWSGNKVYKNNTSEPSGNTNSFTLGWLSHDTETNVTTIGKSNYTGALVHEVFTDNILSSNYSKGVAHASVENSVYTLKEVAKNNIIKNATTFDTLNSTDNIKY